MAQPTSGQPARVMVKLRLSEAPLEGVEPASPHVTASRCALGISGWGFPSFASPRRVGTCCGSVGACCGKWRHALS